MSWTAREDGRGKFRIVDDEKFAIVASIARDGWTRKQYVENTAIVAAAPDLVNALEGIIALCNGGAELGDIAAVALKAVRKVRG